MTHFTKTVLFTDVDGCARFKEEAVALNQGTPQTQLSELFASGGYQLRTSPVGFRSSFHCTGAPQWVFILGGQMEIGIQGGVSRVFGPGEHFFSADVLPVGATFDSGLERAMRFGTSSPMITVAMVMPTTTRPRAMGLA